MAVRWDTALESCLIDLIRQYECIWNSNTESYKRKDIKSRCWNEIGAALGIDGTEASKKFHNIKTTFLRIKKRVEQSQLSNQAIQEVYKPKWEHWNQLSFLLVSDNVSSSESSFQDSAPDTQTDCTDLLTTVKTEEPEVQSCSAIDTTSITAEPTDRRRKRPRDHAEKEREKFYKAATSALVDVPDEDDLFASYIAARLKKIPENRKMIVHEEIMRILNDASSA
ncbi:uncharacterized protein [Centruroides vittatus]|uniref:uncharacterized protein n=1 Tax=Centruroides vittatus TaxID=120091 RepID=UPI00350F7FA6